jgi:hypothetical protein
MSFFLLQPNRKEKYPAEWGLSRTNYIYRNHPNSYGLRKNEVHRIYYENPIPSIPEITTKERELIRKVFQSCKEKKLQKIKWERATTDGLSESEKSLLFDKLMQTGLIEQLKEYNSSNSKTREYIVLTENGITVLKSALGVIENDKQIELSKTMMQEIINQTLETETPQLNRLVDLLKNQLNQIENDDPYWGKQNGEKIKPQTVQKTMPLYYIITKTLCTWVRYYRKIMTKRELSCLSFSGDSMIRGMDASKVLDSIYDSLEQIIAPATLGFEDIEAFGLIKTLELVQMSGSAEICFPQNESIRINGPLSVINSFEHQRIISVMPASKTVLLIENLAVFLQLVNDRYAETHNAFIVFIHGKSSKFLQKVIHSIGNNEVGTHSDIELYAWVDYDLGGIQIFSILESLLSNRRLKAVIPRLNLDAPYREVNENEKAEIQELAMAGSDERQKLGNFILEKGMIEQEYFIRDYKDLLNSMNS